jgi:protoheme IX farnesyltransferase
MPNRAFFTLRYWALAATIIIFITIVLGGMMRANGVAGACPDWPTCFGQWTPPPTQSAVLDYSHRAATALSIPVLFGAAIITWKKHRQNKSITTLVMASVALLLIQIVLGALMNTLAPNVQTWLSAPTSFLHLGLSLLMQAGLLATTLLVFSQSTSANTTEIHLKWASPFARLTTLTLVATGALLLSGAIVSQGGFSAACEGWPICSPTSPGGWLSLLHRGITALSGLLVASLLVKAWRTQRSQTVLLVSTTAAAVLFLAQALLGAKMVEGFPAYMLALHQATASAVWATMVITWISAGMANRSPQQEQTEAAALIGRTGLAKDLLMLTKPIVVALLLVTTYAGMVIGARQWPDFWLTFWTLLGGFMAAGGSGAINQYIDREDDQKMQRTQKRPIPSGRLTPGEGLAFGVALLLASFYLMVAFVNLLAALLSLAGMIYYVLIYSIFLKKTTVQNIVIGGGAGAIPPLVGWAAATGSLNIPSLLLFAVVFMWTPPHFWALALVRCNDYARAGVPMLPVVRGEKETRWQILVYTVELVALTLLLPVFGLGGSIYFIGALVLGAWLLATAWQVWKQEGNKIAWKMYRYSSMYLAFIFFVLMVDRLVI